MISMTGFSQGRFQLSACEVRVVIRSWNHRYFELQVKGSAVSPFTERIVREIVRSGVNRGKVEVNVDLQRLDSNSWRVRLNEPLLAEILEKTAVLRKQHGLLMNLDSLLRLPMLFSVEGQDEDYSPVDQENFRAGLQKVFADFQADCRREGLALGLVLNEYLDFLEETIAALAQEVKKNRHSTLRAYRDRIGALLGEPAFDENRVLLEAAVLAEKTCIAEEIERLRVHCRRLRAVLTDEAEITKGRESDFLLQEMHREAQTIGAKTDNLEISRMVFDAKRNIEKIRQQVQNIA